MSQSTIIAYAPRAGLVRVCPSGCVHVAYYGVTLDFTSDGYMDFAETLENNDVTPEISVVEVECFHVKMRFTAEEYQGFCALVLEGRKQLAQWEFRRRSEIQKRSRRMAHHFHAPEEAFSQN
jgi:hypothetical protein